MTDEQIRAFIAIELPDELKGRLRSFQAHLKLPRHSFIKWVSPDSIHLTLKFLGNVNLKKIDSIKDEMGKITAGKKAFKLITTEPGCFPNPKRIRVFWLGLSGDVEILAEIQREIDKSLAKLGFADEGRPFSPHLTLARVKDECLPSDRWDFAELIEGAKFDPCCEIKVEKISLMRSQLTTAGAIYSRLADFKLQKTSW